MLAELMRNGMVSLQGFILVMFELTINNIVELGYSVVLRLAAYVRSFCCSASGTQCDAAEAESTAGKEEKNKEVDKGNDDPPIEMTDEYLEVICFSSTSNSLNFIHLNSGLQKKKVLNLFLI